MNNWKFYGALLFGAGALLLLGYFLKRLLERTYFPYERQPILTKREYACYLLLKKEADRHHCLICPKVGLKDLMRVYDKQHYMKYFYKISQKHVDFVICDRNLNVLFALELDDASHDTQEAKRRDKFKDKAFKAADLPLKRLRSFNERSVAELFRGL